MSANANGILRCLRFLADEAAHLKLDRTLSAIESALQTAARETDTAHQPDGTGASPLTIH